LNQFKREAFIRVGELGSEEGIGVRDLRVAFKIKKTDKTKGNTAEISIWNLKEDNRSKIAVLDNVLLLEAGYIDGDGLALMYSGNITSVNSIKTGSDVETKIVCSDGIKVARDAHSTISYKRETEARVVLNDIVSQFKDNGIAEKYIESVDSDIKYKNGFAFSGFLTDALSKVCGRLGFTWSIQDGGLKIVNKDGDDGRDAVYLSKESGLIGRPIKINEAKDKSDAKKAPPGFKIKALLNSAIEPKTRVVISSDETGDDKKFRVGDLVHTGDTHGKNWLTEFEGWEI